MRNTFSGIGLMQAQKLKKQRLFNVWSLANCKELSQDNDKQIFTYIHDMKLAVYLEPADYSFHIRSPKGKSQHRTRIQSFTNFNSFRKQLDLIVEFRKRIYG